MSAVVLGREHWYAAVARRWNRAWGDLNDETPTIYVRRGGRSGTWVDVQPARGIDSIYFDNPRDALKHAEALQVLHGWPVHGAFAEGIS
ncbi:hypothetical protein [Sphingomonas beigongshangi]|uniref:hypothetical protein n=1 Tax=Sphingomonas beigongshangi TaxID=2782540 RepID=UPI001AEEFE5F|nr:hypothetical protein [Sphingomonas beigongshangi]